MGARDREDIDEFFSNARILKALSDLGVFAIDYGEHRAFASDLWLRCGYTPEDMNDVLFLELIHPDDEPVVSASLEAMFAGAVDEYEGVFRMKTKAGDWLWIAATYRVLYRDDSGYPLLYLGHDQDVSAIKRAEEDNRRRLEEIETLRQVVEAVSQGFDLAGTVDHILLHSRRLLPYDRCTVQLLEGEELRVIGAIGFDGLPSVLGTRFSLSQPENPGVRAVQSGSPLFSNDVQSEYPGFLQLPGAEPTRSWLGIPLKANQEVTGLLALDSIRAGFYTSRHRELAELFAAHVSLAVEKARLLDRAQTMALTDPLTGAGNRHALQLQGPFFLEKAKRDRRPLPLIMLDLDHFKAVNDVWGHAVGDDVLQRTVATVRACLRPYDFLFRFGGEEFLILLPETEPAAALEIAQRIRAAVDEGVAPPQGLPTVSLGLSCAVPEGSTTLADVIRRADEALYLAKARGRNQVVEA